jgi:hypothetical protein
MRTDMPRLVLVVATLVGGLALFVVGFFVALAVRSALADPGGPVPSPGHAWTELQDHGVSGSDYWLGTTDNNALELRVNASRALRLEPNATSPNVIGGHGGNSVTSGVRGGTIGGGGLDVGTNRVTDDYGTVGGGGNNQAGDNAGSTADQPYATVAGGTSNTASAESSTIGGGSGNRTTDAYGTVGGGSANQAGDNAGTSSDRNFATVGGGTANVASGQSATVSGGQFNIASHTYATVGGGSTNTSSGYMASVGGGYSNTASAQYDTVSGGEDNEASGGGTTVAGGSFNTASDSYYATVGGGRDNTASGGAATVPGGENNTAQGDHSLAAGRRAKANNPGCFVWAESTDADVTCNDDNRFISRASGGVYLYTSGDLSTGTYLAAGSGSWTDLSDRNLKDNFTPVDGQDVLGRLAEIAIATWNYKAQDDSIRHMGPAAQDFSAAFGLGESDTGISTVDADGVALAAIQGLYELSQGQAARIDALEARVAALEGGASLNPGSESPLSSMVPTGWLVLGGLFVVGGLVLAQRRRVGGRP